VSPFGPSFSPQPRVFSRSSLLPTTHHPLPTSFRPLFSWSYKSLLSPDRFRGPLFPYTYKSLFQQPLSFHVNTKRPGVTPPSPVLESSSTPCLGASVANPAFSAACRLLFSLGSLFRSRVVCFQYLTASFCKIPGVGVSESVWQLAFMPINRGEAFRSPQHIVVTTCEN